MTHDHWHTDEVATFLATSLAGCSRVLEVGCGRGHVARALSLRGFEVTALDVQLRDVVDAPNVTFVERDYLAYDAAPFDAVVFTSSLHHIAPLPAAVERTERILRPGGLLVAEEFAVEVPDAATLHWYYDAQELLVAAGCYPSDRLDEPDDDVVARWRRAHEHRSGDHHGHGPDHAHVARLHTGSEMRASIAERFSIVAITQREYLYRYIWHGVAQHARGYDIASVILASERRQIADGLIVPVGLRIVAQRGD